jgi:hypothetical protein
MSFEFLLSSWREQREANGRQQASFVKPLADRMGDGGLAQTSQSGEPIY